MGTSIPPYEADPPLFVDADAVLSTAVTPELFQPIPRRDSEVFDIGSSVNQLRLAQGGTLKPAVQGLDVLLAPDPLGVLATERPGGLFSELSALN